MKKNVFGRRFKRDIKERKALFKSLMSSLVLKERIKTTEAKAKAIKGDVDKLITTVKKNQDFARRFLTKSLSPEALEKLISKVVPRFKNRESGYTRIIRLGKRVSDHAPMVIIEWVEKEITGVVEKDEKIVQKKEKKDRKKPIRETSKENKKVQPQKRRKKTETQKKTLIAKKKKENK